MLQSRIVSQHHLEFLLGFIKVMIVAMMMAVQLIGNSALNQSPFANLFPRSMNQTLFCSRVKKRATASTVSVLFGSPRYEI